MEQPLLPFAELPTTAPEASLAWREAQMLRLIEGIRFNPERLAAYVADQEPGIDRVDFLDFMIERLGGRSQ